MTDEPAPPGWYPAEAGFVRWWDGTHWGPPTPISSTEGSTVILGPTTSGDRRSGVSASTAAALPYATPGDNTKTLVTVAHLGFVLGLFIMPLSIYLAEKTKPNVSPYVRHHAAEALNFQITVLLVAVLSVPLMVIYVGFFTLLAAAVGDVVLGVIGAVQARRGVWWRYPINLRLVHP